METTLHLARCETTSTKGLKLQDENRETALRLLGERGQPFSLLNILFYFFFCSFSILFIT
jgi:hypothetical protein